jgi:hypothetical protein
LHLQIPTSQISLGLHRNPHAPQFAASLCRSWHPFGEQHDPVTHVSPELPLQHVPDTHAPPQTMLPDPHKHLPLAQVSPARHDAPQEPQLLGSVCTLVQIPLQRSRLSGEHAQRPSRQAIPAQHEPPGPLPQVSPISRHVGQHLVGLVQPVLLREPSGMRVRQKMAPLVLMRVQFAPEKLASTRQASLRFACVKFDEEATPRKLASLALNNVSFKPGANAVEPAKSQS